MAAARDRLEAVVREQLTRVVANALQSGVPSTGMMNRATEAILAAASLPKRAAPSSTVHRADGTRSGWTLCGLDTGGREVTTVPKAVTCRRCNPFAEVAS